MGQYNIKLSAVFLIWVSQSTSATIQQISHSLFPLTLHFCFQFNKHLLNHYRCQPFQREVSISFQVAWVASCTLIVSWFIGNLLGLDYISLGTWSDSCSVVPDFSWFHGILQARILEWVAFPFSRGSSQPRHWTQVSRTAGGFFTS